MLLEFKNSALNAEERTCSLFDLKTCQAAQYGARWMVVSQYHVSREDLA